MGPQRLSAPVLVVVVGAAIMAGALAYLAMAAPRAPACSPARCGSTAEGAATSARAGDPTPRASDRRVLLPHSRAYLAHRDDPRTASRGRLGAIARELATFAGDQHGKLVADRLPARVLPTDGPPMFATRRARRSSIWVTRAALQGDHRSQVIYQLAHEAHHLACSPWPGAQTDVVLEMLATLFAIRVMELVDPDYAAMAKTRLVRASAQMPLGELLSGRVASSATQLEVAFYGRAYVLGRELERRYGREAVLVLAGPPPDRRAGDLAQLRRLVRGIEGGGVEPAHRPTAASGPPGPLLATELASHRWSHVTREPPLRAGSDRTHVA